jgi:hypothetical protein
MSMAITVVFPAPVASFRATRNRSGFAASFADRHRLVRLQGAPVLQEALRDGAHLPLRGIRQATPGVDLGAQLVDERGRIVFHRRGRQAVARIEGHRGLRARRTLGPGHGRNEIGASATFEDAVGRPPLGVEFPMAIGTRVWRVENRVFEKMHGGFLSRAAPRLDG